MYTHDLADKSLHLQGVSLHIHSASLPPARTSLSSRRLPEPSEKGMWHTDSCRATLPIGIEQQLCMYLRRSKHPARGPWSQSNAASILGCDAHQAGGYARELQQCSSAAVAWPCRRPIRLSSCKYLSCKIASHLPSIYYYTASPCTFNVRDMQCIHALVHDGPTLLWHA